MSQSMLTFLKVGCTFMCKENHPVFRVILVSRKYFKNSPGKKKHKNEISIVQGDQKNVPPFPGRDEKFSRKTEHSIFKYNLFKYYLENFVKSLQN